MPEIDRPRVGDAIVYRCLAGCVCGATVNAVRPDGRLDLAVETGVRDKLMLTKIAFVCREELAPGTCSLEQGERDGSKVGGRQGEDESAAPSRRAVRRKGVAR